MINVKEKLRRTRGHIKDDVHITPVLNLFLVLVPFLLLTAVFVRIAILELSLPSTDSGKTAAERERGKEVILNILAIRDDGFELKSPGLKSGTIRKVNNAFDWHRLVEDLRQIRQKHPQSEDIVIAPHDNIRYEIVVKAMDRCRENGFINISISG